MNTTHDQPAATQRNGDPLDRAFAWLRSLGIMRDPADRWIGGVCSGVAHRLGVDPVIVRVALVVLTVMGGIGLPAYLLGWSLLPDTAGEIKAESGIRHGDGAGIALLVVTALSLGGVFTVGDQGWRFGWIIPAGLLAYWVSRRHGGAHQWHRGSTGGANAGTAVPPRPAWADGSTPDGSTPEGSAPGATQPQSYWTHVGEGSPVGYDATLPAPPAPPAPARPAKPRRKGRRSMGLRGALVTFGLAIAAYGLGRVLDGPIGFPGTADVLGRILALGVIALAIVVAALRGRTSGLPGFVGVVLALSTAGAISSPNWHFDVQSSFGDRVLEPTNAQTSWHYPAGVGDTTLDLSALSTDPTTAPTITLDGGMGDRTIQIPKGLTVQLDLDPGMGEIKDADGDDIAGTKLIGTGPADVTVKAHSGMGDIIVKEMP